MMLFAVNLVVCLAICVDRCLGVLPAKPDKPAPPKTGDDAVVEAAGKPTKPTVCKYNIPKTYECVVPVMCNPADREFSCRTEVNGTWADKDDIVRYHQECIFVDHFSTCTFNPDSTFECKMAWEVRHPPKGRYTGNAAIGFKRIKEPTTPRTPLQKRALREDRSSAVNVRVRRAGGGTC